MAERRTPNEVFEAYRYCMAHIVIRTDDGDLQSGSAFHIGDGYYVTARHVAEQEIVEFIRYADGPAGSEAAEVLLPRQGVVDLALLKTDHTPKLPTYGGDYRPCHEDHIPIGGHLDDWLDNGMTLLEVVMMGYPPIPMARDPVLVAVVGHVNAVIDKRLADSHPHFVVSALPRGGFSGGPVICQDWLVGVVTESLVENGAPPELGYAAAVSVEPLWDLLQTYGIYPASNGDFLRDVYDPAVEAAKRPPGDATGR